MVIPNILLNAFLLVTVSFYETIPYNLNRDDVLASQAARRSSRESGNPFPRGIPMIAHYYRSMR